MRISQIYFLCIFSVPALYPAQHWREPAGRRAKNEARFELFGEVGGCAPERGGVLRKFALGCASNLHRRAPLCYLLSRGVRLSRCTGRLVAVRVFSGRFWSLLRFPVGASGDAAVSGYLRSCFGCCCSFGASEGGIGICFGFFNFFFVEVLVGPC
jgi:hypothetical protein